MAAYKKKNIKKLHTSKEKRQTEIKMQSKSVPTKIRTEKFKVIRGGKRQRKNGVIIVAVVTVTLLLANLIFNLFHPIGIAEYLSSVYKTLGTSRKGYPIESVCDEIISLQRHDGYFYLLSQSDLNCYNAGGKNISKVNHGLAKPILATSETRALLYGQGEKNLKVYNFDKEVANLQTEKEILSAGIADNGNFAVASYAESYASVVKVYNKKNEPIFEWYSATGTVNQVVFTNNGNKLLVSTFTAENGVINSKIHLLNFKSADAEYSYSFDSDIPYTVVPVSNSKFYVLFEKSLVLIDTKRGVNTVNTSDYSNRIIDKFDNKTLLLSSLAATDEKNSILLFDKNGKTIADFKADFTVIDITYKDNKIYLLGNSEIIKLDRNGNILATAPVSFDTKKIIPISDRNVIAVSNNTVEKIELKEGIN